MSWFCLFIILFLIIRLLISFVNVISFRYLPEYTQVSPSPMVSILIPARNEEQNIENLLEQLIKFTYTPLEIIVFDDNSTDSTIDIVSTYARKHPNIELLQGKVLPHGWLGKNYACHQLASAARGEILLFIDADVNVQNGLIERSLNHFQKYSLHLLSIFPKQIFRSVGEKISVPLMNWILLSFLPLILVRISKNPAFSAANGQFMLFRSDTYKRILPHEIFRKHKVEDISIIRHLKQQGYKTDTLLGDEYLQCRMYNGANAAIEGFTKNIFYFFGNSIFLTVLVGIITTIAPLIVYSYAGLFACCLYIIGIVLIRIFVSVASKQSVLENLVFLVPQHLIFLIIILKGIINYKKREIIWKGRNILEG